MLKLANFADHCMTDGLPPPQLLAYRPLYYILQHIHAIIFRILRLLRVVDRFAVHRPVGEIIKLAEMVTEYQSLRSWVKLLFVLLRPLMISSISLMSKLGSLLRLLIDVSLFSEAIWPWPCSIGQLEDYSDAQISICQVGVPPPSTYPSARRF